MVPPNAELGDQEPNHSDHHECDAYATWIRILALRRTGSNQPYSPNPEKQRREYNVNFEPLARLLDRG